MPLDVREWQLLTQMLAVEKFNENQIINEVSELTLDVVVQTNPLQMMFKNYLAVCTIKVDTGKRCTGVDEKGFYSGALNLY